MDHAQAFLMDQVPLHLRLTIPATLKLAYAAATRLIEGEPILQVTSAAARVILAGAVLPVRQEPAAVMPRKRGSAVRGGDRASARSSHGGPPSNVEGALVDEFA